MVKLISPKCGSVVRTQTDVQREFIKRIAEDGTDAAIEWLLPLKAGKEQSYPMSLVLSWEGDGSRSYEVVLSERDDIADGFTYMTEEEKLVVTNHKVGQKYFVFVNGERVGDFKTADEKFRFIKIDGVLNVRDVGGIAIKQGLLYRGADITDAYAITEEGKATFCRELGIRTEINLRKECGPIRESPLDECGVQSVWLPYRPYKEIFELEHRLGICNVFEFLSYESNYPIFFHCFGGADRTGMIALFLRALLGESEDDILTDYELTSLSTYAGGRAEGIVAEGLRSRNYEYFSEFYSMLKGYSETGNINEAVHNFLLRCGLSEATLTKVKKIIGAEK